jgi:hypothetical protein
METKELKKVINPQEGELFFCKESETYKSVVLDVELDPLDCAFLNDGTVEIDTKDLTYLTLDRETLMELIVLIDESSLKYQIGEFDEE